MEKFNEMDVMKEIRSCIYDKDYKTAAKLAEKLELNKIKSVSSLCLLGEIFLHEGNKDLAEKVLIKAYERTPKGRRALDLLTELYIEKGDYSEAEYYYKEFISVASKDLRRYVLRYRIDKGKGERSSVLIHTLEQLRDYEPIEEWIYELAKLYHEAGEDDKCLKECDEIVSWFGHGEYVSLAMKLKDEVNGYPTEMEVESAESQGEAEKDFGKTNVNLQDTFDFESMMEKSGLNVALNVGKYMEDDEYSDVYDLDEGGKTEKIGTIPNLNVDESDNMDKTQVLDTEEIRAKAETLQKEIQAEKMEHGTKEGDYVSKIQKNVQAQRKLNEADQSVEFSRRMHVLVPNAEEAESEEDEVIGQKNAMDETAYSLFFGDGLKKAEEENKPEEKTEEKPAEEQKKSSEYDDEIMNDDIPVPDTVLDIFATAVDIKDVKKQLAETFTKLESSILDKEDILAPYDINFVVSGTDESMKSQISIGIAKALNTYGKCDKGKIVRADYTELNAMDFSPVFDKISGGCLIIGGAGSLSKQSVNYIWQYVAKDEQQVAIVLEDTEKNLNGLWKRHPRLRSKFLNVINISKYDEGELVKLAESYAKRKGYDITDEVRNVTLRQVFKKRMTEQKDVNYEDVMAVIDEAVISLEKRNMKNLFMTVLDNAYKEAKMFTLLPEDFEI